MRPLPGGGTHTASQKASCSLGTCLAGLCSECLSHLGHCAVFGMNKSLVSSLKLHHRGYIHFFPAPNAFESYYCNVWKGLFVYFPSVQHGNGTL